MTSLASKLGPHMGKYHAGLWEHRILIMLQWESFDGSRSRRCGSSYCAPTFSWVSRTGGAVWYFTLGKMLEEIAGYEFAEVIEVAMDTQDDIDELPFASRGPAGPATVVCFELMRNSGANDEECFVSALVLRPVQDQRGLFCRIGFSIMKPSDFSEYAVFATAVIIWVGYIVLASGVVLVLI
ncbi:hypothetical protein LTR70_009418 [Exophiala xenobiotica]|uniref:Uncharacterized protein n=1 Tax=Lithohypha guttulata TaxID=1690604 RepID=A0ABR0JZ37_9EURO|nr:hypothetical protein LTR24_009253 [Lithohypha guttulata]KAK5310515.1 hypothetical protein LTR70_009418 [Exophiala xenobiotica]